MALKQPSDPVKDSALPQLAQALLQLVREGPSVLEQYRQAVDKLDTDYAHAIAKVNGAEAEYAAKVAALEPGYQSRKAELDAVIHAAQMAFDEKQRSLNESLETIKAQITKEDADQRERRTAYEADLKAFLDDGKAKRKALHDTIVSLQTDVDSLTMKRDGLKAEVKELLARFA